MNSHRPESAEDVINCLVFKPTGIAALEPYESLWKDAFTSYLAGKGCLIPSGIPDDLVTDAERAVEPGDHLYRARRFLLMVRGSPLLPPDRKISVCAHAYQIHYDSHLPCSDRVCFPPFKLLQYHQAS